MEFKRDKRLQKAYTDNTVKCKNCGHSLVFLNFENRDKKICSWCGHLVYANDKIEFKNKLNKLIGELVSKEKI